MKNLKLFFLILFLITSVFVSCKPEVAIEYSYTNQIHVTVINNSTKTIDVKLYQVSRSEEKYTWGLRMNEKNETFIIDDSIEPTQTKNMEADKSGFPLDIYDFSFILEIDGKAYTGFTENECKDIFGNKIDLDIIQNNLGWMDMKGQNTGREAYNGKLVPSKLTNKEACWGMYFTAVVSDSGVDFALDELVY